MEGWYWNDYAWENIFLYLSLCPSKHKLSTVVEYQNGQNDDSVYIDTNDKRMITGTGRVIMTIKMTMTEMIWPKWLQTVWWWPQWQKWWPWPEWLQALWDGAGSDLWADCSTCAQRGLSHNFPGQLDSHGYSNDNDCSSYKVLGNHNNKRITIGPCNTKHNQVGVSGNLLVLVAVLANKQMQSITNMYIVNLSIADILMCLCKYCRH